MRLLFIGDIFASPGRSIVAECLERIQVDEGVDFTIANAENSAGGFGVTPTIAEELFGLGIDVLTSGNHIWDKKEIYPYLESEHRLLRPANYDSSLPGSGLHVSTARNGVKVAVMNLQGRTYMPTTECPFRKADALLKSLDAKVKVRFLDFHAEVTSEKMAMGWYVDGRISACVGTHTHIPTADTRILPGGTAYQTDAGMTGPYHSVIGVTKEKALERFLTALPVRFDAARKKVELHGVLIDIDPSTGQATRIQRCTAEGAEPNQ